MGRSERLQDDYDDDDVSMGYGDQEGTGAGSNSGGNGTGEKNLLQSALNAPVKVTRRARRASAMLASAAVAAPKTVLDTGVKVGQTGAKAVLQAPKSVLDTGVKLGKTGVNAGVIVGKTALAAHKKALDTGAIVGKTILGNTPQSNKVRKSRQAWYTRVTPEVIQLELSLSCQRLPNKDSFGRADSFACLWEAPAGYMGGRPSSSSSKGSKGSKRSGGSGSGSNNAASMVSRLPKGHEREVGRTQVVRADCNPSFATKFKLDYKFQEEQTYVVRIYNEDLRYATDLKEHDFLGGCVFTLGELLGGAGCTIARPLRKSAGGNKSFVVITATEIEESSEVLEFRFAGQDVGLLDTATKKAKNKVMQLKVAKEILENVEKLNVTKDIIDAYYRIEKLNKEDQSWSVVWKSEVIMDNENPTWESARLPLQMLLSSAGDNEKSNGDKDNDDDKDGLFRITMWDWNRFVPDENVGYVELTVRDLVEQSRRGIPVFDIMHEQRRFLAMGKTRLVKNGVLKALKAQVVQIPSMARYLAGGCQLDLMVAVDCTTANGPNWRFEDSLHYKTDDYWNDYQVTLHKIGCIFEAYNKSSANASADQGSNGGGNFSLWGYGGNNKGGPQPFFPMKENCNTAEEMVKAYERTFSVYYNPFFNNGNNASLAQVISTATYRSIQSSTNQRQQKQGNNKQQCYTTLVILTAGAVDDVQASVDAICAAAEDAPLSVVIIGIGPGAGPNLEEYYRNNGSDENHHHRRSKHKSNGDKNNDNSENNDEYTEGFEAIQLLTTGGDNKTATGDDRPRHSNGVPIARDMVHFTAAVDFMGDGTSKCVADALRLVPEQLAQHFCNAGTKPLPPLAIPDFAPGGIAISSSSSSSSSSNNRNDNNDRHSSRGGRTTGNSGSTHRRSSVHETKQRSRSREMEDFKSRRTSDFGINYGSGSKSCHTRSISVGRASSRGRSSSSGGGGGSSSSSHARSSSLSASSHGRRSSSSSSHRQRSSSVSAGSSHKRSGNSASSSSSSSHRRSGSSKPPRSPPPPNFMKDGAGGGRSLIPLPPVQ